MSKYISNINEFDFSLDNFNNQKVYVGALAYAHRIKTLLTMRPGDFPSIPQMGINIQSYRFKDMDALLSGTLKEKISDQITAYITNVPVESIDLEAKWYNGDYYLLITIVLIEEDQHIIYAFQQRKGELINFNFKIYDNEKVDII